MYTSDWDEPTRRSPLSLTPWVRRLLVANAVVYLLQLTVFMGAWFGATFAFSPATALSQPWTFMSYMFVHNGFLHIAFNMLMLFFFGPAVEEKMGNTNFVRYYMLCGLGGAAFSFLINIVTPVRQGNYARHPCRELQWTRIGNRIPPPSSSLAPSPSGP